MTVLLECKDITKEYGEIKVLDKVNLKIKNGEKIGIVGANGTGKTTLANIIYGCESAEGIVHWYRNNVRVGYMKQATDYIQKFATLSGGEKTKKLLNEVLYENYDMLILDEPTNQLDYLSVNWLINEVNKFKGTVLIISHDRYFLDKCVNHIVEIENSKLTSYNGNYSWYRKKKKENYEKQLHLYEEQEKIKNNIDKQITQLKNWSDKAHRNAGKKAIEKGMKFGGKQFYRAKAKKKDNQIKSRLKRLEKMKIEGIEKPKEEEQIFFSMDKAKKIGAVVVRANNISMNYGEKVVFKDSSFYIKQGEKIGLYGVNGSGKTTLIKAILGEIDVEGDLFFSENKNIGYISQDIIGLDENSSILNLFDTNNREELGELRIKLNLLGFDESSLRNKVSVLSMGERMKLKLLLMIKSGCDILILDEPTNHIDLHVREQLESVLESYKGTIILVTHDRYMLDKICNKLLVFKDKKISRCEYGLSDYLERNNTNRKKVISEEDQMILNNKITCILSKLALCKVDREEYIKLDEEYKRLIKIKNSNK